MNLEFLNLTDEAKLPRPEGKKKVLLITEFLK
jgi:hypothetical protein